MISQTKKNLAKIALAAFMLSAAFPAAGYADFDARIEAINLESLNSQIFAGGNDVPPPNMWLPYLPPKDRPIT